MQRFAACGESSEYSKSILFSSTWLPGSIMPHLNMTDNMVSLDCDISSAASCACESINSKMYAATCSDGHASGLGFTVMTSQAFTGFELPIIPLWQLLVTAGVFGFLFVLQRMELSKRIRARVQPYVCRQVEKEVSAVLFVQKYSHPLLDTVMGAIALVVSVEFYTFILPLLFWIGQVRLARQLTLLMAMGIYAGNSVKDLVSAPRPPSPPVRRVISTDNAEKWSEEYGLPSSHTINTICFTGYIFKYLLTDSGSLGSLTLSGIAVFLFTIQVLVVTGRVYLGMHSPIDILAGGVIGNFLLLGWCLIDNYLDAFIISGENVISLWATAAVLASFAYPTPEQPTPSFGDHTCFNGVAFGIVSGVHRTFLLFHSGAQTFPLTFAGVGSRLVVGLLTIAIAKEVSKSLAIILLPRICNLLGICVRSSSYVPYLRREVEDKMKNQESADDESWDVDTAIRLVQYAGLGWSVVEVAPHLFALLGL